MSNSEYDHHNKQRHVHEVLGITDYETECGESHNHRFATISGEATSSGCSHIHEIEFRTDTADGHYHDFCGKTGPAIDVGNGKHVHYANAYTQQASGHKHEFQVASLIESPTEFECPS